MSEFVQHGYGLVITHLWCSGILPVDSEGRVEGHRSGDEIVPAPASNVYIPELIRTTDEGVRILVFTGLFSPKALLWAETRELLEGYRDRVEHLCDDNQDICNEMEEVTAWA